MFAGAITDNIRYGRLDASRERDPCRRPRPRLPMSSSSSARGYNTLLENEVLRCRSDSVSESRSRALFSAMPRVPAAR